MLSICHKLISIFVDFVAGESKSLKVLLSFAVGGLLGDVFLHLLPEAWSSDLSNASSNGKQLTFNHSLRSMVMSIFFFFLQVVILQCVADYGFLAAF